MLYKATISGERLQDHWSSGFLFFLKKHETGLVSPSVLTCVLFPPYNLAKLIRGNCNFCREKYNLATCSSRPTLLGDFSLFVKTRLKFVCQNSFSVLECVL